MGHEADSLSNIDGHEKRDPHACFTLNKQQNDYIQSYIEACQGLG